MPDINIETNLSDTFNNTDNILDDLKKAMDVVKTKPICGELIYVCPICQAQFKNEPPFAHLMDHCNA